MRNRNILVLIIILILNTSNLFCQEWDSKINQIEIDNLTQLTNINIQKSYLDSIRTDSLANLLNTPKIIYNSDSTSAIYLKRFYNDSIPVYIGICDSWHARTIKTDKVRKTSSNPNGLTGNGIIIGEWDGAKANITHQEFQDNFGNSRVTIMPNNTVLDVDNKSHSTHVAGILIGKGIETTATGMAIEAKLWDYNMDYDISEMPSAAKPNQNGEYIRVSNHSYGIPIGWDDGTWLDNCKYFGDYLYGGCEDYDIIANTAKYYLIVQAAGNERDNKDINNPPLHPSDAESAGYGGLGYGTLMPDVVAKNVITVGAVRAVLSNQSPIAYTDFTSWGPSKDGRIKPDIMADGKAVYSSIATNDTKYDYFDGTSMAAPAVAGSIALLLEQEQKLTPGLRLLSSTIKGLILHTATDAGNPGPDYQFGWGVMNTEAAVNLMKENELHRPCGFIREYNLQGGNTVEIYVKALGHDPLNSSKVVPLKATICWNDPAGQGTGKDLINDLDLRLIDVDVNPNVSYSPWVLNKIKPEDDAITGDNVLDNVEQVYIPNPTDGHLFKLVISNKGTLQVSNMQKVSLIFEGFKAAIDDIHIPISTTAKTVSNAEFKYANDNIYLANYQSSYNNLTISQPLGSANYVAGKNIVISNGFKAEYGSKFKAQIFDCSDVIYTKKHVELLENELAINNSNETLSIQPNPTSDFINIKFNLNEDEIVTMKITKLLGDELETLINSTNQKTGMHTLNYDVKSLESGTYFVTFKTSKGTLVSKFVVIK